MHEQAVSGIRTGGFRSSRTIPRSNGFVLSLSDRADLAECRREEEGGRGGVYQYIGSASEVRSGRKRRDAIDEE